MVHSLCVVSVVGGSVIMVNKSKDDKVVRLAVKRMKYPKRTWKKIGTLFRLLKYMPATFTVLQERIAQKGKKMSPSHLDKYLTDLMKWKIIKKDRNLYIFDPEALKEKRKGNKPIQPEIVWSLMFLMPVKCRERKGYQWEEKEKTFAELMDWV